MCVCVRLNYLTCEKNGAIEIQHNNTNNVAKLCHKTWSMEILDNQFRKIKRLQHACPRVAVTFMTFASLNLQLNNVAEVEMKMCPFWPSRNSDKSQKYILLTKYCHHYVKWLPPFLPKIVPILTNNCTFFVQRLSQFWLRLLPFVDYHCFEVSPLWLLPFRHDVVLTSAVTMHHPFLGVKLNKLFQEAIILSMIK